MNNTKLFGLLVLLFIGLPSFTQEHHNANEKSESHEVYYFQPHRLILFTGYGVISGAINEGGSKRPKVIPVLGLDYEFWFNHKIGLGLLNDIELSSYVVEKNDQEYIDRNYAFASTLVFLIEPIKNWSLFAGPGYEFEEHQNYALFKIGTDISKSFEEGWGIGLSLSFDFKEVNSSFSFGVAVGKRFGK